MPKKELQVNIAHVIENKMPSSIVSLLLANAYSSGVISSNELVAYHNNNL